MPEPHNDELRQLPGAAAAQSDPQGTVGDELARLGFPPQVVAATVERLGPGASSAEAISSLCREPDSPLDDAAAPWECLICFEQQRSQGWRCPDGHRFCGPCMRRHVKAVAFPRCPEVKCGFALAASDLRLLKVSRRRLEAFEMNQLQSAIETLGVDRGDGADVLVRCQREGCSNVVLVPRGPACRERFACPCGAPSFCTQCGESPYHFHVDCVSVKPVRQRWLEWLKEARDARKKQKEAQAALQERCERDVVLMSDELWKQLHCRLCPHCRRPVEKLEGCNVMRCGSDYHGGGKQAGCGNEFEWDKAEPYRTESHVAPVKVSIPDAARGKGLFHPGISCSICLREILGPRLRCIHCERFDVCSGCEPALDKHDLSHVFEVICKSEYDWSGVFMPVGLPVRIVRRGARLPPKWFNRQLEGVVCEVAGLAEGTPSRARHERPRDNLPQGTRYNVKIRNHKGSNPEMPAEFLIPLFRTRREAHKLMQGRWNEPEPDREMNVPWIRF